MICKCGETGILNEVLNQQFYYCRACKVEIPLDVMPIIDTGVDWDAFDLATAYLTKDSVLG